MQTPFPTLYEYQQGSSPGLYLGRAELLAHNAEAYERAWRAKATDILRGPHHRFLPSAGHNVAVGLGRSRREPGFNPSRHLLEASQLLNRAHATSLHKSELRAKLFAWCWQEVAVNISHMVDAGVSDDFLCVFVGQLWRTIRPSIHAGEQPLRAATFVVLATLARERGPTQACRLDSCLSVVARRSRPPWYRAADLPAYEMLARA